MKLTIDIPKDPDGWDSYTLEEWTSNIIPEFVEQKRTHQNGTQLRLTDVKRFTTSSKLIGVSLPDSGHTIPEGRFVALRSDEGATCMAMFPEVAVEDFTKHFENAKPATLPGYVRLSGVTAATQKRDHPHGVLGLSFLDTGCNAPGWIQWATEGEYEQND